MNTEILLTDMGQCLPAAALSTTRKLLHWQLLPYETADFSGRLISAGFMTEAPEVRLPVGHSGWHAIYLGLWIVGKTDTGWGRTTMGSGTTGSLKIRLADDPCFVHFRREAPDRGNLEEMFWKVAELKGQDIVVSKQQEGFTGDASLAYVRLVPLDTTQVERLQADRNDHGPKCLIATNDAFGVFFRNRISSREGIWEQVEPYRNTDFKMIWWEIVSGMFGGWRDEGKLYADGVEDFPRPGDRVIAESLRILRSRGINPLKTAMDHAHEIGVEFHVSQRSEMFQTAPPMEECFATDFYRDHPEWRLRDIDGSEVTGMSYAFSGVRSYLVGLLEQATSLGADGAVIIYPRSAPFVLYEDPVIKDFQDLHGIDPRTLPENDERLIALHSEYMTRYMRELRAAMDRVGEKLGRRLALSAISFGTESDNRLAGLDLETWIREGLLDHLSPYPYGRSKTPVGIETAFFRSIAQGTACKVYPNVMPRHMPSSEYRKLAKFYYDEGADGLLFWDTYQRHDGSSQWETMRRLGHREELAQVLTENEPREEPKLRPLLRLAGHHMHRYSPYRGA